MASPDKIGRIAAVLKDILDIYKKGDLEKYRPLAKVKDEFSIIYNSGIVEKILENKL